MWVVCDRFYDFDDGVSGYGQGADRGMIAALTRMIGAPGPDDRAGRVGHGRDGAAGARGAADDRYERLDAGFHARVKAGFREIAQAAPNRCVVVDADADAQTVHLEIMRRVDRLGASISASNARPSASGPLFHPAKRAIGYYSLVSMVLNVDRVPLPAGVAPPLRPL